MVQDEPRLYRGVPDAAGTAYKWEVLDRNGTWQGFRLLDQFPAVKANPKALALADKNIAIGASICEVISTRAGYASDALVEDLGTYMAHHAILTAVRNSSDIEPSRPGSHVVGYFPFGLDDKIAKDYHALNQSIDEYRKASARKLKAISRSDSRGEKQ